MGLGGKIMIKKSVKISLVFILLIMLVAGCTGKGDMKVIVYDGGKVVNDAYVSLYTSNYSQRLRFGYTLHGEIDFRGLDSGVYGLKVIGIDQQVKKGKVHIESEKTAIVKINY